MPIALWDVVLEREYEGIVAKRLTTPYPSWRARLGEGEEPRLLALWPGGRGDQAEDRAASSVRIMGTSVAQIDATYGHLLPDSEEYLRGLLDSYDAALAQAEQAK